MVVEQFTDDHPPQASGGQAAVLLFRAEWHEGCSAMEQILVSLSQGSDQQNIVFGRVDVDQSPALAKSFKVTIVPSFVFLNAGGAIMECVVGGEDAAQVTEAFKRLVNEKSTASVILNKWSRCVPCMAAC